MAVTTPRLTNVVILGLTAKGTNGNGEVVMNYFDLSLTGRYDAASELKTSGALSTAVRESDLSINGTQAFTLPAPKTKNQVKYLYCTAATNTPAGTVTVTNMLGGTTLAFNAVDDCVILQEIHGKWAIVYNNSVTVA